MTSHLKYRGLQTMLDHKGSSCLQPLGPVVRHLFDPHFHASMEVEHRP
jgi:hypothetical protein